MGGKGEARAAGSQDIGARGGLKDQTAHFSDGITETWRRDSTLFPNNPRKSFPLGLSVELRLRNGQGPLLSNNRSHPTSSVPGICGLQEERPPGTKVGIPAAQGPSSRGTAPSGKVCLKEINQEVRSGLGLG